MTGNVVISAEDLGKKYFIGHEAQRERYVALRDVIERNVKAAWRAISDTSRGRVVVPDDTIEEFWALKDVSFEVKQGDVLGVIGRNGAGKSTLLKILSRITEPSAGRVIVRGRVASLLEVGTGFHPELTGRENIYLNGAILGMTRNEIRRKFDEIVAFAEVERFLDTPVKRYSSGMYVRLAFAVAAHLEPEILIIDEVLAVGDAEFQKKCLGKMSDVATGGRTVLFVSHNLNAVRTLCDVVALIDRGRILALGEPPAIIGEYINLFEKASHKTHTWDDLAESPGNDRIRLHCIQLVSGRGPSNRFVMSDAIAIDVRYSNLTDDAKIAINAVLYSIDGSEVFEDWSIEEENWANKAMPRGIFKTRCCIPGNLLNVGTYSLHIIFFNSDAVRILYEYDEPIVFSISDEEERSVYWHGRYVGHVHPRLRWTTQFLEHLAR
jgi:lipopolysaccharide transport system ATP-binding protein